MNGKKPAKVTVEGRDEFKLNPVAGQACKPECHVERVGPLGWRLRFAPGGRFRNGAIVIGWRVFVALGCKPQTNANLVFESGGRQAPRVVIPQQFIARKDPKNMALSIAVQERRRPETVLWPSDAFRTRLAVIVHKNPWTVAPRKAFKTYVSPQYSGGLCNDPQLHATSPRLGRSQLRDDDLQYGLPATPCRGPITAQRLTDLRPT